MSYPTPPGERIAYDLDGSVGVVKSSTRSPESKAISVLPAAALTALNSDKSKGLFIDRRVWEFVGTVDGLFSPTTTTRPWIAVIFPTPMRLRGVFSAVYLAAYGTFVGTGFSFAANVTAVVETSQDTTNGEDGTWTTIVEMRGPGAEVVGSTEPGWTDPVDTNGNVVPGYIDSTESSEQISAAINEWFRHDGTLTTFGWQPVAGTFTRNVKAIRARVANFPAGADWEDTDHNFSNLGGSLAYLHLYGEPDEDATENRLEFVTADGSAVKDFDWDDIEHGEVLTTTFRLRNLSTLTAETIDLSFTPSVPSTIPAPHAAMEFSLNGVTFTSTLMLTDIDPESDSDLIYARLTVPAADIIGNWAPRVLAEVGDWV